MRKVYLFNQGYRSGGKIISPHNYPRATSIDPENCKMTGPKLIDGDALVISASTIVNINIFYIRLQDVPNNSEYAMAA